MHSFLLPRGIRNNNPGNIRLGTVRWQGQKPIQQDTEFVEFEAPQDGIRALMKLLLTYQRKYGLDTVESIINRYAPPHENATDHYIHSVCKKLGVRRRDVISLENRALLCLLAKAIIHHENGAPPPSMPRDWFEPAVYAEAMNALS
jgi:hypothetical protein